jgi:hypothetical protein
MLIEERERELKNAFVRFGGEIQTKGGGRWKKEGWIF